MWWTVKIRTAPCYTDGSPVKTTFEGTITAYAKAETAEEAHDVARCWLSDLSESARIYTAEGKPKRALYSVHDAPWESVVVAKPKAGAFSIIYAE